MKFLKSDNIDLIMITLTGFFYWYFNRSDLGLGKSDHISRDKNKRLLLLLTY